jgi:hypothetical protein
LALDLESPYLLKRDNGGGGGGGGSSSTATTTTRSSSSAAPPESAAAAAAPSRHDVIVMRNLADGTLSFAIDEFPDMDPDAAEAFWRRKVDRHRAAREVAFAEIEQEFGTA